MIASEWGPVGLYCALRSAPFPTRGDSRFAAPSEGKRPRCESVVRTGHHREELRGCAL